MDEAIVSNKVDSNVIGGTIPATSSQQNGREPDTVGDNTVVLRRKMSWNKDLGKYLEETVKKHRSQDEYQKVRRLIDSVTEEYTSADSWWALLYNEECAFEDGALDAKEYLKRSSTQSVILFDLYDWATRLVPQKGNKTKPAFVNIWLGHARQQWLRGRDDALDAIKALKTQQIGLSYAPMYIEWASIEAASDNVRKALSVIGKGIRENAQPMSYLQQIEQELKDGTFVYKPFWSFSVDKSAALPVGPSHIVQFTEATKDYASIESKTPGFTHPTPSYCLGRPASGSQSRSCSTRGTSDDDATISNAHATTPSLYQNSIRHLQTRSTTRPLDDAHRPGLSESKKADAYSRLVTPISSKVDTINSSQKESVTSLSARRPRISYNKITSSCEKLAKSLPIEDSTMHRALQAIPENIDAAEIPNHIKPLVIDGSEDTSCVDEETIPVARPGAAAQSKPAPSIRAPGLKLPTVTPVLARNLTPVAPQPTSTRVKDCAVSNPPEQMLAPQPKQQASAPNRRVIENESMVIVRDIKYTKLECVGKGGSSKVYKVMAPNKKIFALKRIRLNGRDAEAANGFLDEITLLTRLKGKSNIIQLIDSEVHKKDGIIYMVLECGDIDLAKLLQRHEAALQERKTHSQQQSPGGIEVDENFIRMYWEQMLHAVDTIHRERIVHSDLKPANFLMVEGQLKLIDFGIAKAIQADTTSIARESQVGTLNYMSPEAITGGAPRGGAPATKVGRASDIWSLGCILYQMVYGKTPFAHLPFIQKMHAIIDESHAIAFPPISNPELLDVIKRCLQRHPKARITMPQLLEHPFLHPHASKPTNSNSIELSKDQLRELLQRVASSGVENTDVNVLSEQLFRQLQDNKENAPDVAPLKTKHQEERIPLSHIDTL